MTRIVYSDGTSESFEYDAEGRNTKSTDRLGLSVTYTYDKVCNLMKQTDAKGNVTKYEYDKNGSRTKVIYADGSYVQTKYDERGRTIWQKDMAGRETAYTYDSSDRLISVEQNNGSVTGYQYDQTGNLTGITDANGNTITHVYDENSRRIKTILADGAENTCEYDALGMLIASTDYNGVKTTYRYDEEDRLIRQVTGTVTTTYAYDSYGRLTDVKEGTSHIAYRYNRYGELSDKTYENGQKVSYAYDTYGRLSGISVSQNSKTITSTKYGYDSMNRLTRVVAHDGTATVYTYDANGNRETATFANGEVLTFTYDELNRLVLQKEVDRNGTVIAQYSYTLGKGGERTNVTETGACGNVETSYDYDRAGRLTKEVIEKNDGQTTYFYTYDAVGNRLSKQENGEKTTYTYNSRNQLVSETSDSGSITYSYDSNGNLLNKSGSGVAVTYTYDVFNRLVKYADHSNTETYTYDAEGVRRSKKNDVEDIVFVSDTTGSLSYTLAEFDSKDNLLAAYTRADTLISQIRDEVTSYYLYDGHGDVRALLNEAGRITDKYRYNAYGELVERSGDTENHYLYTGEYYDGVSDLYYLRARYMSTSTGTFISMDTYEGSIYDPDTLHKYLYANGNPVMYTDPSGQSFGSLADCLTTVQCIAYLNFPVLNAMGMISAATSAAVTSILGGDTEDVIWSAIQGYVTGFGLGLVLCMSLACSVATFAITLGVISSVSGALSSVMLIWSITQKNERAVIVYGALVLLSIVGCSEAYNIMMSVSMTGDNGIASFVCNKGEIEDVIVNKTSSASQGIDFYVNPDGVVFKNGTPCDLIENPNRTGSYGVMDGVTGKYKEVIRIDPATPHGKKGPQYSHYHINGEHEHLSPRPGDNNPLNY